MSRGGKDFDELKEEQNRPNAMKQESSTHSDELVCLAISDVLERSVLVGGEDDEDEQGEHGRFKSALKDVVLTGISAEEAADLHNISAIKLHPLAAAVQNLLNRGKLTVKLEKLKRIQAQKEAADLVKRQKTLKGVSLTFEKNARKRERTKSAELKRAEGEKVSTRKGYGRVCIPTHWNNYPLVVEGAIRAVTKDCRGDSTRLFESLCDCFKNNTLMSSAAKKHSVAFSTFQCYHLRVRTKLSSVLGSSEPTAALKDHLHPAATFEELDAKLREIRASEPPKKSNDELQEEKSVCGSSVSLKSVPRRNPKIIDEEEAGDPSTLSCDPVVLRRDISLTSESFNSSHQSHTAVSMRALQKGDGKSTSKSGLRFDAQTTSNHLSPSKNEDVLLWLEKSNEFDPESEEFALDHQHEMIDEMPQPALSSKRRKVPPSRFANEDFYLSTTKRRSSTTAKNTSVLQSSSTTAKAQQNGKGKKFTKVVSITTNDDEEEEEPGLQIQEDMPDEVVDKRKSGQFEEEEEEEYVAMDSGDVKNEAENDKENAADDAHEVGTEKVDLAGAHVPKSGRKMRKEKKEILENSDDERVETRTRACKKEKKTNYAEKRSECAENSNGDVEMEEEIEMEEEMEEELAEKHEVPGNSKATVANPLLDNSAVLQPPSAKRDRRVGVKKRKTLDGISDGDQRRALLTPTSAKIDDNSALPIAAKPRRRRKMKSPIPEYWREYPTVVTGVLEDILSRCVDDDLKNRLFAALQEFMLGGVAIPDITEKHLLVLTTFRRYLTIFRNALKEVLGYTELCSILADFLTPTTPYLEFKRFFHERMEEIKVMNLAQISTSTKTEEEEASKAVDLEASDDAFTGDEADTASTPILFRKPEHGEKMSGSPFSPLSRTKMKRRLFSGTTAELRSEIKSILKNRHTGDVDAMVNIVTGAIVKEIGLRAAMETSGISLDLLLAAYSFCGRQIALDKVEIVDLNSTVGFMANNGVESMVNGAAAGDGKVSQSNFDEFAAEEQKPTCSTSNKNLDSLDAIGGRLMSAFGGAVDKEEEQFKAVIDYVVEVGYKRAKEDQNRLKSCLEEVLIDGISVQGALAEFPSLRRVVALEYSQRCQKVHKFLLLNVRDLLEKIGAEKQKKQKGPLTLADVLSESDVGLLKSFLKDLQKLNCAATPELVRHLAKRAVSAKSGASFKWTPAIDESLLATGIMAADGFAEE